MSDADEGMNKAALLLLSLGPDEAAEVLKHMTPREVQKLGMAMTRLQPQPREVIESLKLMEGMYVGINEVNLDFAPAFWGKSNLGIFTTQTWIVEADLIEALYAKAEKLYELVAKKHGMSSDIASVY